MLHLASRSWPWILARGILAILFGIFTLIWPGKTLLILAVLIGIWLVMDGVGRLFNAFALRTLPGFDRVLLGIFGVISLAAGVFALANPAATLRALVILLAVWLFISGFGDIAAAISIRKEITGEWLLVVGGVLSILFGVVALLLPGVALATAAIIIGIDALVMGLVLVFSALRLRKLSRDQDGLGVQ